MENTLSYDDLRKIVRYCKNLKPKFSKEAALAVQRCYVSLRANDLMD